MSEPFHQMAPPIRIEGWLTVGGRPAIQWMSAGEVVMLETLTRLAAKGALHENASALGAHLMQEADALRVHLRRRQQRACGRQNHA